MPPGLLVIGTDLWVPWGGNPSQMRRNMRQFNVLARLAPGASLDQANVELGCDRAAGRAIRESDVPRVRRLATGRNALGGGAPQGCASGRVRPARGHRPRAAHRLRESHQSVSGALVNAAARAGREAGAWRGRWRVMRLLMTESVLLAIAGGAVGLVIAWVGLKSAGAIIPAQFQIARSGGRRQHACAWLEPGAGDRVRLARRPGSGRAGDAHRSA